MNATPSQPLLNLISSCRFIVKSAPLVAAAVMGVGAAHGQILLQTNSLTIGGTFAAPTGTLDLTTNGLVVYAVSGLSVSNASLWIKAAFHLGAWDGFGITSTAAATDPTFSTTVGVMDNSLFLMTDFFGHTGILNGASPDLLFRYTYYGDADLNGRVNGDDFDLFNTGFFDGPGGNDWTSGDFDYSGNTNGDDFDLFQAGLANAHGQIQPPAPPLIAPVPEPGVAGLLSVGIIGALSRRQRKQYM